MFVGQFALDPQNAIIALSFAMIALCAAFTFKRPLGGSGAFVVGYTLYFAGRPLYVALTGERKAVSIHFNSVFPFPVVFDAQCLLAIAMIAFVVGTIAIKQASHGVYMRRLRRSGAAQWFDTKPLAMFALAGLSLAALAILFVLSRLGRGGLYGSDLGAYAYQLPILLHGFVMISMVLALQRCLVNRRLENVAAFLVLLGIFLAYTVMMRNLTLFRAFYMSGFLAGGFACLYVLKGRLTMKWLIIPVIVGMPLFQYLGQQRAVSNEELLEEGDLIPQELSLTESYSRFFMAHGDMNMFDTFVTADNYTPSFRPYVMSWLYVPFHFIPRFIWKGKPEQGITMDLAVFKGAPYSPGIPGFFLLDGGRVWMMICMFVLGCVVMGLDLFLYTLPRSALSGVLIGVATVYALYLPRFLLWQYVYGMLFFIVPGVIVWFMLVRKSNARTALRRSGVPAHAPPCRVPHRTA